MINTATYGTVITTIGAAKIMECITSHSAINITHAAVGDGKGAYYKPTTDSIALRNECWRGEITSAAISGASENMIDVAFIVPADVGGFVIREAALIDADGDTIAICNTPDTQKIAIEDGVSFPLKMVMHIVVADASVVEFTVTPALDNGTVVKGIRIPAGNWVDAGANAYGEYVYVADVADIDATSTHFPDVALDIPSLEIAVSSGLCPVCQTLGGAIRFWSIKKPTGDMVGTLMLCPNVGGV